MYKQNKGLADKLFRYTSYAVLAASLGCGYVAANRLIASSTPRQTTSLLNSENKSTPLQWNVRFTKEDKQKYCPGHEKRIRRLCWNDHKTVYCDGGGCQTRSSNSLETKIYTASSVQELNKKVHQDLKSRGIDEPFYLILERCLQCKSLFQENLMILFDNLHHHSILFCDHSNKACEFSSHAL